jgi:3-(3-hydroxy-phenyl)propionate hydroxylase
MDRNYRSPGREEDRSAQMNSNERYEVAIVGMGPVGAVLACLLGRAGVSVIIVDRELAIYDKPRAIVLDHEALRILQACEIERPFFDSVSPHTGTDFVGVDGQLIKLFDPKAPPFELGWSPNVTFIQPELEQALARRMARLPNVVHLRGLDVFAIEQSAGSVNLRTVDRDKVERSFEADWVVGADGANSIVRETAELGLDDMDFAEWWAVVDAWLERETTLPAKTTQYCQPSRPATYVVGPRNLRRWEIKLLPGEDPESFRDDAKVRELLSNFAEVDALKIWRSAVYRFRAAVARRWRNERLLIAGDAAHTMPPFLAQGLCAGVRDAGNLAWKLIQVLRHGADAALLDSYELERKPHVSAIIRHAKEFGLIIGELVPERAERRDSVLAEQLRSGAVPTERQAFVPDLEAGLIDDRSAIAGSLFVQPLIRGPGGADNLMDDVIGPEFLIVARQPEMCELDPDLAARWAAIGGQRLLLGGGAGLGEGIAPLHEVDGRIAGWLQRHDIAAAIVRPDRYVYGVASDPADVSRMVREIVESLRAGGD